MPVAAASDFDNPVAYAVPNPAHPDAQIAESITAQAVADGLPGVVLLVSTPQDGTWVSAKGLVDLKNGIPMKLNNLSRIGSVTKMFTAVALRMGESSPTFMTWPPSSRPWFRTNASCWKPPMPR